MIKCSFCDAQTRHFGEIEVDIGWGKIEAQIGQKKIELIHCPLHFKKFAEEIKNWAKKDADGTFGIEILKE